MHYWKFKNIFHFIFYNFANYTCRVLQRWLAGPKEHPAQLSLNTSLPSLEVKSLFRPVLGSQKLRSQVFLEEAKAVKKNYIEKVPVILLKGI